MHFCWKLHVSKFIGTDCLGLFRWDSFIAPLRSFRIACLHISKCTSTFYFICLTSQWVHIPLLLVQWFYKVVLYTFYNTYSVFIDCRPKTRNSREWRLWSSCHTMWRSTLFSHSEFHPYSAIPIKGIDTVFFIIRVYKTTNTSAYGYVRTIVLVVD